jgi:hypothetical protein
MNKTIKLSLATAMVAGMVSTSSAKTNLEDAIKDTTIKGYISYTMEKYMDKNGADAEAQHDIDVRVQFDSKINDNYSFTVRVDEANDDDKDKNPNDGDTTDKDSSPLQPEIDQVYTTYKNGGLKVKAGMQKVVASNLHDSINGDGIIVTQKLGAAAVTGGYFYTTEKTTTDEIAGLNIAGKAGIVKYNATYATIIDSDHEDNDGTTGDNGATVVDINLGLALGSINIDLAQTTRSDDESGSKDQSLTKAIISGKAGAVSFAGAYAIAGEDGANVAIDGDADASVNLVLNEVSTDAIADGSAIYGMVGAKLGGGISAKVEYVTADADGSVKSASEYMVTLTNKVSKKMKLFAKYNGWEVETTETKDYTKLTLGAKYSF